MRVGHHAARSVELELKQDQGNARILKSLEELITVRIRMVELSSKHATHLNVQVCDLKLAICVLKPYKIYLLLHADKLQLGCGISLKIAPNTCARLYNCRYFKRKLV